MTYDKAAKAKADALRYQRTKVALSAKRKQERLAQKPPTRDGTPTREELLWCIEQGYCWWCQRGGFQRLGHHTAMAHQVYAKDLRELAILLKTAPTCVAEESATLRERRLELLRQGRVRIPDWRLGIGVPHEYSEAGMISMRANQQHMIESVHPARRAEIAKKAGQVQRKPHPCPVCGTIIPRAKPICCSPECRAQRHRIGLEIGHRLWHEGSPIPRDNLAKGRKLWQVGEYRAMVLARLSATRQPPQSHKCPMCGKMIRKSRPKYCSWECGRRSVTQQLPIGEIKARYMQGESSIAIAASYGCCDHTIRRHLKKAGVSVRPHHQNNPALVA